MRERASQVEKNKLFKLASNYSCRPMYQNCNCFKQPDFQMKTQRENDEGSMLINIQVYILSLGKAGLLRWVRNLIMPSVQKSPFCRFPILLLINLHCTPPILLFLNVHLLYSPTYNIPALFILIWEQTIW